MHPIIEEAVFCMSWMLHASAWLQKIMICTADTDVLILATCSSVSNLSDTKDHRWRLVLPPLDLPQPVTAVLEYFLAVGMTTSS